VSYVDLNTIHNPATGTVAPAAWGDQIRENDEFLIDPPACAVFNSTTQSLTNDTVTMLSANSEFFDNDAMHSTVTNNSRITIQTAGRYLLIATVEYSGAATTGYRSTGYAINGTAGPIGGQVVMAVSTASTVTRLTAIRTAVLAVGDYVETTGHQTSGGNLNCSLKEFAATYLTR
jgi:hypothetical protein